MLCLIACGGSVLLTLPAAAGLIVLSESIVGVVYQHGRFTAFDTEQTALALSAYLLRDAVPI